MDQKNIISENAKVIGKPSWVAYIRMLIRWVLIVIAASLVSLLMPEGFLRTLWVWSVIICYPVYRVMYVRSTVLYTDDEGVWFYRGVFPWQKGVSGVLWRDLDGAAFRPNFLSWICRSYNVQLQHRHTKSNELNLRDIAAGEKVVEVINRIHRDKFANES